MLYGLVCYKFDIEDGVVWCSDDDDSDDEKLVVVIKKCAKFQAMMKQLPLLPLPAPAEGCCGSVRGGSVPRSLG